LLQITRDRCDNTVPQRFVVAGEYTDSHPYIASTDSAKRPHY
jgi:hypothetical protein